MDIKIWVQDEKKPENEVVKGEDAEIKAEGIYYTVGKVKCFLPMYRVRFAHLIDTRIESND